ncbi:MAG: 2-C-methyl-D-erythritol 2,4-cyclodiphosphate synthase [Bacilli bacterium]
MIRIGHSHDTHQLVEGRPLILGGVLIDYHKGALGHSDSDVVYHVVCEAIIGALGLGDIGTHFPDTNPLYKDFKSSFFVTEAYKLLVSNKYHINNIDLTIYLEEPNLKDYKLQMKKNIAALLKINPECVNVKATRGEKMGFIGRKEGISAEAVILIEKDMVFKKL